MAEEKNYLKTKPWAVYLIGVENPDQAIVGRGNPDKEGAVADAVDRNERAKEMGAKARYEARPNHSYEGA